MISRHIMLLAFTPLLAQASQPITWSLAGMWRVHDANNATFDGANAPDHDWRTIRVPANWYSAGYDHQGALWYRHEFTLPKPAPDIMTTLVFEGVDYFTDVILNGKHLARHEGYFQRFSVDVSDALYRHNKLAVRVDSPREDPKTIWPLHKTMVKGVLNQHDTRLAGPGQRTARMPTPGGSGRR